MAESPSVQFPSRLSSVPNQLKTNGEGVDTEKVTEASREKTHPLHSSLTLRPGLLRSTSCPLPDSTVHPQHRTKINLWHGKSSRIMSQHTYGSIPTSEGEAEATTLVHRDQDPSGLIHDDADSCCPGLRHRLAEILESKRAHMVIVALTIVDILLVMLQIGASLLHLDETNEEVWYLELFEHISLAIVSIFMAEILLKLFTFGPKYFWKGTRLGMLHLADAIIITLSFFLEVFLKNVEARELGSLLIVFRLWRVIKLTGTVAIEVNEQDSLKIKKLEERIKELEQELAESQAQVTRLRQYTEDQA